MRALIVMPLAERRGGAEESLDQLIRAGRGQGVEWSVAFLEDGPMVQEFRNLGVDARVVAAGRLRQVHRYVRAVVAIRTLAKEKRADVILGWMTKAQLYGGMAAASARIPAVWYQHGIPIRRSWMDRLATLLPAQGVVATSQSAAVAQSCLWPVRATRVVYPGVSLARFDPSSLPPKDVVRRALNLPADGPVIGYFGRLQSWKGTHVLIEAMPRVLEAFPDAYCLIVGGSHDLEPDYPAQLQELITARHLEERALLAGFQANIPQWMHASDVVVLPSENEPFGITVIEAMALGKPVIAGGSGGPREIITNGVDGLLVSREATAVSDAILHCLDQTDFTRSVGKAARERATQFTSERYAVKLLSAVTELARGQR